MRHFKIELSLMGFGGRADMKEIVSFRCSVPDADADDFGRFLRLPAFGPGVDVQMTMLAPEAMVEPDEPVCTAQPRHGA